MWGVILIAAGAFVVGVLVGVLICRGKRRVEWVLWRARAVEMARMNNVLMDRMEALENERQKEA